MLTFKDVCIQLRLLENDHELENTLERASSFRTFDKIYGQCPLITVMHLWDYFKDEMIKDFQH